MTAKNAPIFDGKKWTAILLAGQRPGIDPLAEHYGIEYKALVPIGGISMLARVTQTLLDAPEIGKIIILGQEPDALIAGDMADLARHPSVALRAGGDGIASSIAEVVKDEATAWPVLVTTADHALLTTDMVAEFLVGTAGHDVAFALGERKLIEAHYPMAKRTWLKFSDGHFSGANLFAFRGPQVLPVLAFWSSIEKDRKKAWRILSSFGPWLLLRAATRSISIGAGVAAAGKRLGVSVCPVIMSQPEATIDVDKPSDLELAEAILSAPRKRPYEDAQKAR